MEAVVTEGPIGERIRIYRKRRGLGQKELAGLVGRSESWLSQVERGIRSVDRLSVLIDIARVLKTDVETLAGYRMAYAPNGGADLGGIDEIRDALSTYPGLGLGDPPTSTLDEIENLTTEVHQRYQAADYGAAARLLPGLIAVSDAIAAQSTGDELLRTSRVQSQVYVAAAKLVTKVGDGQLAWLAADRAANAAMRAESEPLKAMAAYQVACAFLKLDQVDQAERIAINTAENFLDDSPLGLSVQGALFLVGAVIAGRRTDRLEATERLRRAQYLADALGHDGNFGWTAFGPTNVAIHQVSTAAELGDAQQAIAQAENINTSSMPTGLLSRRAQVHIDTAWAYSQHHDDPAVVINLMEAERVAPQTLRYNIIARELLRELLKRERRTATPGLRALAERSGVLH